MEACAAKSIRNTPHTICFDPFGLIVAERRRTGCERSFSTRLVNLVAALGTAGALPLAEAGGAQAGMRMVARVSISGQAARPEPRSCGGAGR